MRKKQNGVWRKIANFVAPYRVRRELRVSGMTVFCQIIAVAVAIIAVVRGFRLGLVRQTASVLGLAFGVVGARVLRPWAEDLIETFLPGMATAWFGPFLLSTLSSILLYCLIYGLFSLAGKPLQWLFRPFGGGAFDAVLGSAFAVVRWLLALSLVFNLMLCLHPDSRMLDACASDDGNLFEAVALIAPALLGGEDADELAHRRQIRDARSISQAPNIMPPAGVSTYDYTLIRYA